MAVLGIVKKKETIGRSTAATDGMLPSAVPTPHPMMSEAPYAMPIRSTVTRIAGLKTPLAQSSSAPCRTSKGSGILKGFATTSLAKISHTHTREASGATKATIDLHLRPNATTPPITLFSAFTDCQCRLDGPWEYPFTDTHIQEVSYQSQHRHHRCGRPDPNELPYVEAVIQVGPDSGLTHHKLRT